MATEPPFNVFGLDEVFDAGTSEPDLPNMALAQRHLPLRMAAFEDDIIRTGGATAIDQLATRLAGDLHSRAWRPVDKVLSL